MLSDVNDDLISRIRNEAPAEGVDLEAYPITTDDELVRFALSFLLANLHDAFEGTDADTEARQ